MTNTLDRKFETIEKGFYCGHSYSADYVIRDQSEWEKLWGKTNSIRSPRPIVPKIDFTNEMVLGVYLGQRSSGGYSIEITKLVKKTDCLEAHVTEGTPNRNMMVTMALTQPYHLVKTAKTDKEIKFVR